MTLEAGERIKLSRKVETPLPVYRPIDEAGSVIALLVILGLFGAVVIALSIIGIWLLVFGIVPTAIMVFVLGKL